MAAYSREELLEELQAVAARLGTTSVSRSVWLRESGINEWQVLNHFDSWNEFIIAAGLTPDDRSRVEDDDLLCALADAFREAGGVTTRGRARRYCRYSPDTYAKRWGKWANVLARLREWVAANDPEFPFIADLPLTTAPTATTPGENGDDQRVFRTWDSGIGQRLGPFLNFRGLQHAPINEQGVVFLFGMVAFDLGYVVEGVGTGFPDCDAKRSTDSAGRVWERVRIEFEYRSRNFQTHGHDPAGCDLIVCWEHNWADCPVEVLELCSALGGLTSE